MKRKEKEKTVKPNTATSILEGIYFCTLSLP